MGLSLYVAGSSRGKFQRLKHQRIFLILLSILVLEFPGDFVKDIPTVRPGLLVFRLFLRETP